MKNFITTILPYAAAGGFIATLARMYHYARPENKHDIIRKEDGKVHWRWMMFENTTRILVAMSASVFVGIVVIPHATFLDEYAKLAITGFSAIVGEQIWNIIGYKIKAIVEQWSAASTNQLEEKSKDRRKRNRSGSSSSNGGV